MILSLISTMTVPQFLSVAADWYKQTMLPNQKTVFFAGFTCNKADWDVYLPRLDFNR